MFSPFFSVFAQIYKKYYIMSNKKSQQKISMNKKYIKKFNYCLFLTKINSKIVQKANSEEKYKWIVDKTNDIVYIEITLICANL